MKQLEARLATSSTQQEATAAKLQLCQEELRRAQDRLEQLIRSCSSNNIPGDGNGSGGGQGGQPVPLAAQAAQTSAGGSFPVGFGSVEQQQCLDQLGVATQQLAQTIVTADNLQHPLVQHLLEAAKGSLDGPPSLVSSWDRDSCAAALHHHVLNTALDIAQQQQLQQAKGRTLFLVAQQQAPSHPATREVAEQYVKCINEHMQGQLEQQLGLGYAYLKRGMVLQPQLVAVAAAMTRVNLLLASLQSSCLGLQLGADGVPKSDEKGWSVPGPLGAAHRAIMLIGRQLGDLWDLLEGLRQENSGLSERVAVEVAMQQRLHQELYESRTQAG
ncbi:hypothetical protein HaLaN_28781 [Haematococcus lacustris]|uniref:Uncharacterized protein n=1 Tax=Haematococcus lacustris TaxID=44745 RepID=A0A6A0ACE3_HAELA|nr:hypothetical protein HaLaN_28781 [Haematococcus lacustris]